jgi:SAM-dependent methyltransferase
LAGLASCCRGRASTPACGPYAWPVMPPSRETRQDARALAAEVAASVNATPKLLPILPELVVGLDALGSPTRRLANLLDAQGLGPRSRVLDLACGKGALAIRLARITGCHVLGVDAFEPFVAAARDAAAKAGVGERCTFVCADVRRARALTKSTRPGGYDVAIMAGLWDAAKAAPLLRVCTRPGGLYLFDDAVRDPRRADADEFLDVPTRRDVVKSIEEYGDGVLAANLTPVETIRRSIQVTLAALEANATTAARRHPNLRAEIRRFIAAQGEAEDLLIGPLRPMVVLAQKQNPERE